MNDIQEIIKSISMTLDCIIGWYPNLKTSGYVEEIEILLKELQNSISQDTEYLDAIDKEKIQVLYNRSSNKFITKNVDDYSNIEAPTIRELIRKARG